MRRKAAVVAVIKLSSLKAERLLRNFTTQAGPSIGAGQTTSSIRASKLNSLGALSGAALVLPGLISPLAHAAEGDEVDFQYSHYQEGKREIQISIENPETGGNDFPKVKNSNPIEVESLHGSSRISLTDHIKFSFNYIQDTWGGATPISTAPSAYGGNDATTDASGNTITGASPYVQTPNGNSLFFSKNLKPYVLSINPNSFEEKLTRSKRLTHILSTASPETRKQGDFKLSYDWDEFALNVGGGISVEDDYESRFGNIGARWDFNHKQTTVNADLSYTNSDTNAILDHDLVTYIENDKYYLDHVLTTLSETGEPQYASYGNLVGNRQDWSTHLGINQILNKSALVGADFNYTRSTGYLGNPYKLTEVFFVDPDSFGDAGFPNRATPRTAAFLERRPDVRNQWQLGGRFVQYVETLDAALHFDYHFSADDWGVQAHTFEADWVQPISDSGWTVTPKIRYYSQDQADFYVPFLVSGQAYSKDVFDGLGRQVFAGSDGKDYFRDPNTFLIVDAQGNPRPDSVSLEKKVNLYDPKKLPSHFSSDQRLSGFGTLSGGVTVAKQFAKGLTLETGFEYYTHQGALKLGGGGEQPYADFDFWVANAALKVNLDTISSNHSSVSGHTGHSHHVHGGHAPAGVLFDHMLPEAGDFMVGYRYMWNSQGGPMLHGADRVTDPAIVANGCGGDQCYLTPDSMAMHMHMLDLMYAPANWLTLMLMPQWMDMDMALREPIGSPEGGLPGNVGGHLNHHTQNNHQTGGIGDLGMYALFKLFDNNTHHFHVTAGLSAPTGDVDIQFRGNHQIAGGFQHYGMQLGSGTWDFKPSVTYTGHLDDWSWGAQANGIVRMENNNESGYRLGDLFQATAWGGYAINNWLSASLRGVYTVQGRLQGQYPNSNNQFQDPDTSEYSSILKFGPMDYPQNYGGRYWDIGFGLSAMVPSGDLAGNRVSVEWLQPVEDDVNGYQLERDGALSATWSVAF